MTRRRPSVLLALVLWLPLLPLVALAAWRHRHPRRAKAKPSGRHWAAVRRRAVVAARSNETDLAAMRAAGM